MKSVDIRHGATVYTRVERPNGVVLVEPVIIVRRSVKGRWFVRTQDGYEVVRTSQRLQPTPGKMKRRTLMDAYLDAVDWIAQHDSAGEDDALEPNIVSELVTASLVAQVFEIDSEIVGRDIVLRRKELSLKRG